MGKQEAKAPKGERTVPWLLTLAEQACDISTEICGQRGQQSSRRKQEAVSQPGNQTGLGAHGEESIRLREKQSQKA